MVGYGGATKEPRTRKTRTKEHSRKEKNEVETAARAPAAPSTVAASPAFKVVQTRVPGPAFVLVVSRRRGCGESFDFS